MQMGSLLRNTYLLIVISFAGWLSTGCDKSASETAPQSNCRIQRYESVTNSKFYEQTGRTTYEYDVQGNLLKMVTLTEKRPASGAMGSQSGNNTIIHTYDNDGFLTTSTRQELYITTMDKTIREQITTMSSYSYVSGRLSGYTKKRIGAYGITVTITGSLAYDAAGNLVSKTETNITEVHDPTIAKEVPANPVGAAQIWIYQKGQLADYVQKSGATETHPFIIQNGVVTKIIGSNYEVRNEYDGQQRLTKNEFYVEGRLNDYRVQTWTDAKPMAATLSLPKGFPAAGQILEYNLTGVLASYKSYYWNSVSSTMQQYNEITHSVQTNAQGFVTNTTITGKHPNPSADQDYTTTETYTYTGCQ